MEDFIERFVWLLQGWYKIGLFVFLKIQQTYFKLPWTSAKCEISHLFWNNTDIGIFLSNNTHTTIHDTNKCNGSYFLVYEVFVLNNNKYFQKLRSRLKINSKNTSTFAEVSCFFTVRILITFLNNLLFLVTDQKLWNLFHDVIHE